MRRFTLLPAVLALALALALTFQTTNARADVVFSTLNVVDGYDYSSAIGIHGTDFPFGHNYVAVANQFVAAHGGNLGSIELPLHYDLFLSGPGDQVDLRLALDVNGQLADATTLTSGTLTLTTEFGASGLTTFIPSSQIPIVFGATYWLVISPHANSTIADWNMNSIGAAGVLAISGGGNSWSQGSYPFNLNTMNAFRVNTGVIPEPSTAALAVIALPVLMLHLKRKSQRR